MPLNHDPQDFKRVANKVALFFKDFDQDIKLVGEVAAEGIIRTTLAGIGEGDQPFAEYSQAYKELIESVGGKPQQTVNLRGLFYHAGQKRVKFKSEKRRQLFREGRQAFVGVRFTLARRARKSAAAVGANKAGGNIFKTLGKMGGKARGPKGIALFTARSGITRPTRGVTDPLSEMSLDLIKVTATVDKLTITYTPRVKPYMIFHQEGRTPQPMRKWFTINRAAVRAAMLRTMQMCLESRALQFNLPKSSAIQSGRGIVGEAIRQQLDGGK